MYKVESSPPTNIVRSINPNSNCPRQTLAQANSPKVEWLYRSCEPAVWIALRQNFAGIPFPFSTIDRYTPEKSVPSCRAPMVGTKPTVTDRSKLRRRVRIDSTVRCRSMLVVVPLETAAAPRRTAADMLMLCVLVCALVNR